MKSNFIFITQKVLARSKGLEFIKHVVLGSIPRFMYMEKYIYRWEGFLFRYLTIFREINLSLVLRNQKWISSLPNFLFPELIICWNFKVFSNMLSQDFIFSNKIISHSKSVKKFKRKIKKIVWYLCFLSWFVRCRNFKIVCLAWCEFVWRLLGSKK